MGTLYHCLATIYFYAYQVGNCWNFEHRTIEMVQLK